MNESFSMATINEHEKEIVRFHVPKSVQNLNLLLNLKNAIALIFFGNKIFKLSIIKLYGLLKIQVSSVKTDTHLY